MVIALALRPEAAPGCLSVKPLSIGVASRVDSTAAAHIRQYATLVTAILSDAPTGTGLSKYHYRPSASSSPAAVPIIFTRG